MAKLGCNCGHVITDQMDNVPYKAYFKRDQDLSKYSDKVADDILSFFKSINDGQRSDWIRNYFSDTYPVDLNDASIIFDIISSQNMIFESYLYQCDKCGRVKIQIRDTDLFASFKPEDDNYKNIFMHFK